VAVKAVEEVTVAVEVTSEVEVEEEAVVEEEAGVVGASQQWQQQQHPTPYETA
jgi:hypothetical protein